MLYYLTSLQGEPSTRVAHPNRQEQLEDLHGGAGTVLISNEETGTSRIGRKSAAHLPHGHHGEALQRPSIRKEGYRQHSPFHSMTRLQCRRCPASRKAFLQCLHSQGFRQSYPHAGGNVRNAARRCRPPPPLRSSH